MSNNRNPSGPILYVHETVDALKTNLRAYILGIEQKVIAGRQEEFRIAISGGSMPQILADALLPGSLDNHTPAPRFSAWKIFFVDERCVPHNHKDSNFKAIQNALINKLPEGNKPAVFGIDEESLKDPRNAAEFAADKYWRVIRDEVAKADSVRIPMFHLVLLGCGEDGHTASLFPNSSTIAKPQNGEEQFWVLPVTDSPKPPKERITLSLQVITHGINIAFVATGSSKKEILHDIFDTEKGRDLPCGRVNNEAQKVLWFTDSKATELTQFPSSKFLGAITAEEKT